MIKPLPISEIAKIPFVDAANLYGRTISTLSFHDGNEWRLWLPAENQLIETNGQPCEGFYFAKESEHQHDVYFEFLNFTAQRACWPSVLPCLKGIRDDLFNVAASLKKFEVLYEASKQYKTSTSRFVVTELEYLFSLCRSVFDLLQEMIALQWESVELLDKDLRKKSLPRTFSKVVLHGNALRTEEEISRKFDLPIELSQYYSKHGEFFSVLRTFRDRFVHGGNSINLIYVTEKGFAVHEDTEPFANFDVWDKEHQLPNGLCSLRPALAYIVCRTLEACEDYARTIQRIIGYPPPLVPNMLFFMRSEFTSEFHNLRPVLDDCKWWSDG